MITPIEIRQHTFKKSLRGYDKEEVASFLNTLSVEWERLLEDHKRTKIDLEKTQANLDQLKEVESALHKTLLQAEQTSKATMENAKKDAELKVQEAEAKAKELVKSAMENRSKIEMQIDELISRRNEILQQLKSYLQAQTERLQTFEQKEMKGTLETSRVSAPATPVKKQAPATAAPTENEKKSFFESSGGAETDASVIDDIADEL